MPETIEIVSFLLIAGSSLAWVYFVRARRAGKVRGATQAYRLATELADEGIYTAKAVASDSGKVSDWIFTDCNQRGASYFGLAKQDLIGKKFSAIYPAAELQRVLRICDQALTHGHCQDEHEAWEDSSLKIKWLHRHIVKSEHGLSIAVRDISDAKHHALQMARLANEDPVTTLPNRRWLGEFLPPVLAEPGNKIALLFIDLDDFKNVNDALGHTTGDLLLRSAAMRLQSVVGANDRIVRMGGDEFAIVMTQFRETKEVKRVASLVNEILRFPLEVAKGRKLITASIGISLFPDDAGDMDTLLKSAEIAMYAVKTNGKGHSRFYDPTLYQQLKDRLALEQELSDATEKDQFVLYYEPRMSGATGRLCGMEALVRWIHPERGLIAPLEFISVAESTGLILKLGDLIIDKAFRQIVLWKKLGLPLFPVSINVSALQFSTGGLSRRFREALETHKVNPQLIQIELTESIMLGDEPAILKELEALRSLGIKLLIDDFGTGYSSLSQLQRLRLDTLKVDRAFLRDLGKPEGGKAEESKAFVNAIVSMAHALGMSVIAEGVENQAQMEILRSLSCDELQGYYFSKPLHAEAMSQLLECVDLPFDNNVAIPASQPTAFHDNLHRTAS
jgi:diguanylate cyclase (GGDEF)-like protein